MVVVLDVLRSAMRWLRNGVGLAFDGRGSVLAVALWVGLGRWLARLGRPLGVGCARRCWDEGVVAASVRNGQEL